MYPRSIFWYRGTSACTLVPLFGTLEFFGKLEEFNRDRKKHDSQRRDRILFFLHAEIGQFSPHFGAISLLNYTVNLEKRGKSTGDAGPSVTQATIGLQNWNCAGRRLVQIGENYQRQINYTSPLPKS